MKTRVFGRLYPALRTAAEAVTYLAVMIVKTFTIVYLPLLILLVLIHFPWDTDSTFREPPAVVALPATALGNAPSDALAFYRNAYAQERIVSKGMDYEQTARESAEASGIEKLMRQLVAQFHLENGKVLDVGSGRGHLQYVVADYTGLDMSPSAARYYHKPFVVGSATDLPFKTDSFDAVWTVWVLEHIPQPEKALAEMRRVVKPGGLLFLFVAWNCSSWATRGMNVRPYEDFDWWGKLVKATVPIRRSGYFQFYYRLPTRCIRWLHTSLGDRRLRYRRLEPDYEVYWEPDSDAAVSLDSFETFLWFRARGDDCVNCGTPRQELWQNRNPMIIRVHK